MNVLIVSKISKLEYEQHKFGLSKEDLMRKYSAEHANLPAILEGHESLVKARAELQALLPDAKLALMTDITAPITGYDLVILLGGDNSFTYVSHYVGDTPIMAINSDPHRSLGALCSWSSKDLNNAAAALKSGNYRIEEWTRLQATVDGKPLTLATSEYFFGERGRKDMTRHILIHRGNKQEQKCSGVVISTGAGSTGWYDSASRYLFTSGNQLAKTEKKAVWVVAEPHRASHKPEHVLHGELLPGEQLILHSLNDAHGLASADSWEEYDFPRGKTAIITLSDKPLRVVVPRE
ncbi:NAD(+)/NADH kinase [Candidatus Woesearchaeota archaeon]|nr:NAD(+)/NADH kinase [Candidatus Woesearchaeota archaeon]